MKREEVDRSKLSPMMSHYMEIKDKYPDYIEYINMYINILNKYIGGVVLKNISCSVDVHNPDVLVTIEIRVEGTFIYTTSCHISKICIICWILSFIFILYL